MGACGSRVGLAGFLLSCCLAVTHAEIDGHGPDAWRVHGVAAHDVLNARVGPGTSYPVVETFAHDERGLQQVTCVPLLIAATYEKLSQTQLDALAPSWCLMRSADLSRAGWVLQRHLVGDADEALEVSAPDGSDAMIADAVALVRALYKNADSAANSAANSDSHPLHPSSRLNYFSADVVKTMQSQPLQADPIFGAQDFSGSYGEPVPDPDGAMFRGMISVNVEIVNFGQSHTATLRLRADPAQPDAPIRIFRIEHDGWSFP